MQDCRNAFKYCNELKTHTCLVLIFLIINIPKIKINQKSKKRYSTEFNLAIALNLTINIFLDQNIDQITSFHLNVPQKESELLNLLNEVGGDVVTQLLRINHIHKPMKKRLTKSTTHIAYMHISKPIRHAGHPSTEVEN